MPHLAAHGLLVDDHGVRIPRHLRARARTVAIDGDPLIAVARFGAGDRVRWPAGFRALMSGLGRTRVEVADQAGESLSGVEHDFGGARRWQRPTDERGRPQALNKWGWWTVPLGSLDESDRNRALEDLSRLLGDIELGGIPVWLVGGTLLGAVRDGRLIPHDDDLDVAYLSPDSTPDAVALGSFALERALAFRGWWTRRFSGAHFQVRSRAQPGRPGVHIDVFSAFFREGMVHQPFHIRGPLRRDQLVPLASIDLHGRSFPAPRDVAGWLELNYGPGWPEPDPEHVLGTPREVERLYSGWFGRYQPRIEYWEDRHGRGSVGPEQPSPSARWLAATLPAGTCVVELGCGSGVDADHLASRGLDVLATDFVGCDGEIELPAAGLSQARLNLADARDLMRLALRVRGSGRPVHIHARHVLDRLDPGTRRSVLSSWRLFPSGTTISMTVALGPRDHEDPDNPDRSRLSWRTIRRESLAAGLAWRPVMTEALAAGSGGTLIWAERTAMAESSGTRPRLPLPSSLREAKLEIAELRRMPLRLAELQDLVVSELARSQGDSRPEGEERRSVGGADG